MSLSEAAKKAGLDISYLCRLETTGKRPPSSVIRKLAGPYDVGDVGKFFKTFGYLELSFTDGLKEPRIIPDEVLAHTTLTERQELKRFLMFLRTQDYIQQDIVTGSQ